MRKRLLFRGDFSIEIEPGKSLLLFNDRFYLETNFFWLGYDRYVWEQTTRKIWVRLCKESEVIFDVGSNTGIYALLAKVYSAQSHVHAFEPQPNVYEVLKKNCELNQFDIHHERVALSNTDGNQEFYNYGSETFSQLNTTAGSLNKRWKPKGQSSIIISVKTLKDYIEKHRIKRIDLIKVDVETLEFEVLAGYGKYLHEQRPIIILEIQNVRIGQNVQQLFDSTDNSYFHIDEAFGLRRIDNIDASSSAHKNYLICPEEKQHNIADFILD